MFLHIEQLAKQVLTVFIHLDAAGPRFPARPLILMEYADISYTDVHFYPPGSSYHIDDDLDTIEYDSWDMTKMPLIMGEYGGLKPYYSNDDDAVGPVADLLDDALNRSGFCGALYWIWNITNNDQWWPLQGGQQLIKPVVQDFFNNY